MENKLQITAAQINPIVGDLTGNTKKIISSALYARDKQNADLVIFPEAVLTGYPPEDLLLRPELHHQVQTALKKICTKVKNIYLLLGTPTLLEGRCFNSALLIYNGKIQARYHKQYLPNYGVFDEKRYFTPGKESCFITIKDVKIALAICADLMVAEPMQAAQAAGAQLMVALNASPFDLQKYKFREQNLKQRAREGGMPIIYVNLVGGQDELVFDGGSMVINSHQQVTQRAPFFTEQLMPIQITTRPHLKLLPKTIPPLPSAEELIYQALLLGVRDYVEKNRFKGVVVSISGGIDSALTLAIAVDALGKERVAALYLPSRHSSNLSTQIVTTATQLLGITHAVISIEPVFKAYLASLPAAWQKLTKDSTIENIQARCRAVILMAFSNKKKLLVLSTGNKSELAVGYTTLYGDMVGGFSALKDLSKTLVYRLAKYRNKLSYVIPKAAITRTPSAELAPNQKDSDTLPPYPLLDKILKRYIEQGETAAEIIKAGFAAPTVKRVISLIQQNEYKRRQAPPGVKITTTAFGRERRYPITSRFLG